MRATGLARVQASRPVRGAEARAPGWLPVTVIVATRNEEANLDRCLGALAPAVQVLVVDSGSTDRTVELARAAGAEVVEFRYGGGYPKKRQWALTECEIRGEWVALVDADEVVTEALWREVAGVIARDGGPAAYAARKEFHFLGRRFRFGGFSHSAVFLFRRGRARFEDLLPEPPERQDMEVHERLLVDGPVGQFRTALVHEDFKGLDAYTEKHSHYASWEAAVRWQYLRTGHWGKEALAGDWGGDVQQMRRWLKSWAVRVPFEANLWFLYHYVLRLGLLEGRRGLIASQLRANYIREVRAKVFELELREGLD
jgi:glycosyltransferase involved in cell wall biosynthesis